MKMFDEIKGKEVIDTNGDKIGEISNLDWNPQMNKVKSIIVSEGAAAKIGLGDNKILPIDRVESIGDKVLIKGTLLNKED